MHVSSSFSSALEVPLLQNPRCLTEPTHCAIWRWAWLLRWQASSRNPKSCRKTDVGHTSGSQVGNKGTQLVSTNYWPGLRYMLLFNPLGTGVLPGMADKTFASSREPCPHLPRPLSPAAAPWPPCWIYHRTQHKDSGKVRRASL